MPSETPARETFDITGMTCAACQSRVQKVASETKGVTNASVNLLKNSMELTYDGDPATIAAVVKAIDRAGYGAEPRSTATPTAKAGRATTALVNPKAGAQRAIKAKRDQLVWSIVFGVPLFYLAMGPQRDRKSVV